MESGKPLSEHIAYADKNKMQIVLIGMGAETGTHAAMIALMRMKDDVYLVNVGDLPEADQKRIELQSKTRSLDIESLPKPETFIFENYRMDMPEVIIEKKPKPLFAGFPKNRRKKSWNR